MRCFLTSKLHDASNERLNEENGLLAAIRAALPKEPKTVFVCSDPDHPERTDYYAEDLRRSFAEVGIRFSDCTVLDRRTQAQAAALIREADMIFLAGGHVPTQNRFFHEIGLRELLQDFDGVVFGMSAGSMNSADLVYAQPELEGEAIDPEYQRFLPGLGLTEVMILPHYQMIKDDVVDGLRAFEDIAYPDSMGRTFHCLVDGSYLLICGGEEWICGEAYTIRDGVLKQVSEVGERVLLKRTKQEGSTTDRAVKFCFI